MSTTNTSSSSSGSSFGLDHDLSAHLRLVFENAKAEKRPVFSAYITVGFPRPEESVPIVKQLQDSGADIIELGVPFSDPMAEGPTIQKSNQVALDNGVNTVEQCIQVAKQARASGVTVPLVFMGYFNTFRSYGESKVVHDCHAAGINGFIIVDLPPEESEFFRSECKRHSLSYIPLIALTTRPERIRSLVHCADSFIYAVSLLGVTGTRSSVSSELPDFIARIKKETDLPVAVGFGISKREHFVDVGKYADGIVVGSAIINTLDQAKAEERLSALHKYVTQLTGREKATPSPQPPRLAQPYATASSINGNSASSFDASTSFGAFGGRYVPETLVAALDDLWSEYQKVKSDPLFFEEVKSYYSYIGRPSSLHIADRLTAHAGGATIWLKREDLNHTGAHKINNAIAQALLAKRLGKTRLIAETGAGQHGVASATIAAKLGIPLTVYMGAEDVKRQALNVFRMELLGAKVVPVHSGSKTLKDAINEAMRDWVTNIRDTHYLIGSAIGPHPFPTIVRDFQSVIGQETKEQFLKAVGHLPDAAVACVGGGSNAIGMFYPFKDDTSVRLVGVEAGGDGVDSGRHSATLAAGTVGVLHGTRTYLLQDAKSGQIQETHSISAGLDYPGVGPEHAYFKSIHRAEYVAATDKEALEGFQLLTRLEGIMPALESSHAVYYAVKLAKELGKGKNIVICLSGRGDKDVGTLKEALPKYGFAVGPLTDS